MANWQTWRERPLKSKRMGVYASLNANAKNPILIIGKPLRDNGFDSELQYTLLFDSTTLSIGLRPSEIGRKITVGGSGSHFLPVKAFCQHFGLTKNYEVLIISKDDDIWVLKLQVRQRRPSFLNIRQFMATINVSIVLLIAMSLDRSIPTTALAATPSQRSRLLSSSGTDGVNIFAALLLNWTLTRFLLVKGLTNLP